MKKNPPTIKLQRPVKSHKGDYGRVLILAGSPGFLGAACLATEAALRAGAGLVTLGIPKSSYPFVAAKIPCAMTLPVPETSTGQISKSSFAMIQKAAAQMDALAFGPGIGRHPSSAELLKKILSGLNTRLILDADALNLLAKHKISAPKERMSNVILTPHPGEFARLTGRPISSGQKEREKAAKTFAKEKGCVLVLKGHGTVVSDGDKLHVNHSGNPGMATGGSGDVLTGILAALCARHLPRLTLFEAACFGVHLHGLAGDLAVRDLGQDSLIASDLIAYLPKAFQAYIRGK